MAVKRRLTGYSGMRVDWPHVRSIESAMSYDFDQVLRGLVTGLGNPYIIRGFDLEIPAAAVPASSLRVTVADSAILHSSAAESGTIFTIEPDAGLDVLSANSDYVVGSFQNGTTNYVSLELIRSTDTETVDQTSGWSQSQKTAFSRTVPTAKTLGYRYIINSSSFSTNLPLWIVKTASNGNIVYITQCKDSLFRLGRGGSQPNPYYMYDWNGADNSAQFPADPRHEWVSTDPSLNPVSVLPGQNPQAFNLGDFAIRSLKEWMDAIMTRLKEITGSSTWYGNSIPIPPISNLAWDSIGSVMTGTGSMVYNMIYEIIQPTSGAIQTQFTDLGISGSDSYIYGVLSQNQATLSAFYNNQLLIHSQLKTSWTNGETIWNRRIYRPLHPTEWYLDSNSDGVGINQGGYRLAVLRSEAVTADPSVSVSSWSYDPDSTGDDRYIEIVTATPHGLSVGDYVNLDSLQLSVAPHRVPEAVFMVKEVVDSVTYRFHCPFEITGTPAAGGTSAKVISHSVHPYMPKWAITEWGIDGSVNTIARITAPSHTMSNGDTVVVSGLVSNTDGEVMNGRWVATVESDLRISFDTGVALTGTVLTVSSAYLRPDSHSFILSVADAVPDVYNIDNDTVTVYDDAQLAYAIGPDTLSTQSTAEGAYEFDGVVAVMLSTPLARVLKVYNYGNNNGNVAPYKDGVHPNYSIKVNVDIYHQQINVNDITFVINGDTTLSQYIRTYDHMDLRRVKYSISSIVGGGATVTVTTSTDHELATGDLVYIMGTGQAAWDLNEFSITRIDDTSFSFVETTVDTQASGTAENKYSFWLEPVTGQGTEVFATAGDTWNNPPPASTLKDVFIRYVQNPYAGPIQWTSDIIVKGIVGDLRFSILQTAHADGSIDANRFNSGGLTGTAYLKEGEVAYLKLKRNLSVTSGATYISGGGDTITGPLPLDEDGNSLQDGDFVKFVGESDVHWCRINGTPSAGSFTLIADNGQQPTVYQRPANQGALLYCKGKYDTVTVQPHYLIDEDEDIYWIAVRRDNGSPKSRVYLRGMELEQGEVREINDNEPSNLLIYTGAGNEAAVNPNYSMSDEFGEYTSTEELTMGGNPLDVDIPRKTLTFETGPKYGFAEGDKLGINTPSGVVEIWTVDYPLSSLTVVVKEDISNFLSILAAQPIKSTVTYYRSNFGIEDSDNLTKAQRKTNRFDAKQHTDMNRPIYDESIVPLLLPLSSITGGELDVHSGSYIYQTATDETAWQTPTALAWVIHGSWDGIGAAYTEDIEDTTKTMPAGDWGDDYCLIHVISGDWKLDGGAVYQYLPTGAVDTGRTVNNPTNPDLVSPTLASGTELVLPPNRRTQVTGSGSYIKFGSNSNYKSSLLPQFTGEELMVIVNDTIREAEVDYQESFGGPKGMISLLRDFPPNSRLRFRVMAAYGSALIKASGGVSLQIAYDNGSVINTNAGTPVDIRAGDSGTGGTALKVEGSLEIDGKGVGGIFGPRSPDVDQIFVIGKESNKPNEVWTGENYIKSHTGYAGSAWSQRTASGLSSGASLAAMPNTAVTVATNKVARICMTATARATSGAAGGASFRIEGTFYNIGAGVVAAGSPVTTHLGGFGEGNLYAVAFGVSGNDVQLVVLGTSGSTIQWVFSMDYQVIEDSL